MNRQELYRDIIINRFASSVILPSKIRNKIYKNFGININKVNISPQCFFGGNNIKIGDGSFINYKCFFDNTSSIELGENNWVGMEVMFCTSTHEVGNQTQRAGEPLGKPILIGNGCWIGTRATILPGVKIADGCIIAAGAVVNKDCEPNGLYAGVPARRIKDLD